MANTQPVSDKDKHLDWPAIIEKKEKLGLTWDTIAKEVNRSPYYLCKKYSELKNMKLLTEDVDTYRHLKADIIRQAQMQGLASLTTDKWEKAGIGEATGSIKKLDTILESLEGTSHKANSLTVNINIGAADRFANERVIEGVIVDNSASKGND